ncbi:MAG: hypothetical protein J0H12_01095 [Candidatus Paracaedimonas acanthamoebae]|uniref:Peptidase S24/S26A/S26B/S26C domain-containing protein n=1 Tax=Candidatus Paracaedimonas acanthamoebae TaxID=244581 RepID=A0A8J7TSM6_9PROT|nr:hypothetical protein [Candidatus Paracaedimonas acanthamoebae]
MTSHSVKEGKSLSSDDEKEGDFENLSLANHLPKDKIDLNEHFIKNSTATFFLRAASDALKGAGISKGDLLVVDRSSNPASGAIVIAELDGELSIRQYEKKGDKIFLSTDYSHIEFLPTDNSNEIPIWGIVTTVIRSL